ncbi:MAG: acyl-phosphate glycerol 3-phosphate acyltransferase [Planctomycetota bacterium]|nr:MAG: acyl-phosphate glycerol 3-phosphate acyltransferase [Planctomycetota bacterium]
MYQQRGAWHGLDPLNTGLTAKVKGFSLRNRYSAGVSPPPAPVFALLAGYLLGSVSFALLLARLAGVNLRQVGSGNLGATNAGRALGAKWAVVVYCLDALKGWLVPWVCLNLEVSPQLDGYLTPDHWRWLAAAGAGAGAWMGHVWPLWHGFKGGKGAATLSGAFLALEPMAVLGAAVVFLLATIVIRYMSVSSMAFGLCLPLSVWLLDSNIGDGPRRPVMIFACCAAVLTFWTHRSNLGRLRRGEETPIGGNKQ